MSEPRLEITPEMRRSFRLGYEWAEENAFRKIAIEAAENGAILEIDGPVSFDEDDAAVDRAIRREIVP